MRNVGDRVLVKTRKELLETGYTEEEVNSRKQFIGKFATISDIIESYSIESYNFKGDKNNLKWYNDMLKEDCVGYMSDTIKDYCDNYCIYEGECPEDNCTLFKIKNALM